MLIYNNPIYSNFKRSKSIRFAQQAGTMADEQWRDAVRLWKERVKLGETRRGIRLSVIAAKLRPIDKVKNLRWIYDVGRGGWSAAIARPCVVNRRWRGTHMDIHTAWDTRHMESSRAITTLWKACRFTGGKASNHDSSALSTTTSYDLFYHSVKKIKVGRRNSFFQDCDAIIKYIY